MASPLGIAARAHRFASVASAVLIVAGCTAGAVSPGAPGGTGALGGTGSPGPSPELANLPDLGLRNVTTEQARARGATIGPAGGTITATADNGVEFSLTIPERSILEPTQVGVYPAAGVAGLSQGTTLSAAVQFAPDGLDLLRPATLTITYPAAVGASTGGIAWTGDGAGLHGYPARVSGTSATVQILHFSGVGLASPPLQALFQCNDQADLETGIASGVAQVVSSGGSDYDALRQVLRECYQTHVAPALRLQTTGDFAAQATVARDAYDMWLNGLSFLSPDTLQPELGESKTLAAAFLLNWYDTFNASCVANEDNADQAIVAAELAISMPKTKSEDWGVDTRANRLDYESLLNNLCVKIVIDPSRSVSASAPGAQGTVTVPVGYTINGSSVRHDRTIRVWLTMTGASTPFADGDAPSDGNYTAPVTWPANVSPLRIDVLAGFPDPSAIAVFDRITKHAGSKIAMSVRNASGQILIEVMDEDGTHLHALTSGPVDTQVSWSPDGRKLVFARHTQAGGSVNQSIQVINADGTGLTALTSGPFDASPAWAPDGSRIAFVRAVAGKSTIVLMNPDGTNVVDSGVKVLGTKLTWSPDSKQIAYSNIETDGSGTNRLWIWSVGGGTTKLATPACQPWGAAWPDWSSTGTIAFLCDTHGNPNGSEWIATISGTGGGYRAVTGNLIGKIMSNPTWSPDGTNFAIAETTGIVVVPVLGGGSSPNLGTGGGTVAWLDWGP